MRIIGRLKNGDFLVLFAEGFKVLSKKVVMAKLSGKYSVPVYIYDRNDFFNSNVKSFITKEGRLSRRQGSVFNEISDIEAISVCPYEGKISGISLGYIHSCRFKENETNKEYTLYYLLGINEVLCFDDRNSSLGISVLFDNPFVFYAGFDGYNKGLVPVAFMKYRGRLEPIVYTQGLDFLYKLIQKVDTKEHPIPFVNLITSELDYSGSWKKGNLKPGLILKSNGYYTLYNCLIKSLQIGQGICQEGNVFVKRTGNSVFLKIFYTNDSKASPIRIIEGDYDAVSIFWTPTSLAVTSNVVRLGKSLNAVERMKLYE